MNEEQKIVIIAGPNGVGKTTFAREFLVREAFCPAFVNADLIAAGLSPFNPDQAAFRAGRLMLEEISAYAGQRESFAFETTLSGRLYARYIPEWKEIGYRIELIFLSLPNAEIAVDRVRTRVSQGGHHVDNSVIRRRFDKGRDNFHNIYKNLVDAWALYDNSAESPQLIDAGENP
jgi:predicted ABC-type ATPase